LGELVRHRHLGAELIYEAYNVDIEPPTDGPLSRRSSVVPGTTDTPEGLGAAILGRCRAR